MEGKHLQQKVEDGYIGLESGERQRSHLMKLSMGLPQAAEMGLPHYSHVAS